ncbi:MAG: hypothetical protein SGJ05_00790 [bacterium]|nr:hypothetical protein [bacterium]
MLKIVALLLVSVTIMSAQPEGTWINMRFIEELKAKKSVLKAMSILRADELLVIRAVRQRDSTITLFASRTFDDGVQTEVSTKTVGGVGDQRRITALGQTWLLGIDKAKGEYLALHSTVDSNALPDVFAYIPSKNQNADFIYQRVLNSATLSGTYQDAKGKIYAFSSLQHAKTPKLEFNYRIIVMPDKPYQIMEVVSDKPKPTRYAYEVSGDQLSISTFKSNGSLKPLYKLKKQ